MKDLKFSVLFNEGDDGDGVVGDYIPRDGMEGGRCLRRDYTVRFEMMRRVWMGGRTWMTTFPGASITSW